MSVNKVILIGRVGGDPDVRQFQNGNEVANFSVATSERWKDKNTGEKREKTEWHRVAVFGDGLVGMCKRNLVKGQLVYIEGKLQTRKWQAQDGTDRYATEVVLQGFGSALNILDWGDQKGNSNGGDDYDPNKPRGGSDRPEPDDFDDDFSDEIPF